MQLVTFAELKESVRELADEESSSGGASSLIGDGELGRRINEAVRDYYSLLVEVQGHEYFAKDAAYDLEPDKALYSLPLDFFQALRLVLQYDEWQAEILPWSQQDTARHHNRGIYSSGFAYWLWFSDHLRYRIQGQSIEMLPAPKEQRYRLLLRYTPTTPRLVNDTDTIDAVNGWDDWVKYKAAILLLVKSETDTAELRRELALKDAQIRALAPNRDVGRPETIQDTRRDDWSGIGYSDGGNFHGRGPGFG
jgi:hypothetical protein